METTTAFVPFALPDIGEAEIDAVVECLRSGWLTTGPRAAAFEEEFAAAVGGGVQAVAVNSATSGLHLALEAAGVGPGDEVIVPTWTFTASAEVVRYLGADPVVVDVTPDTLTLDWAQAARRVGPRTKAVMPVHLAGLRIDPHEVADFAAAHDLLVVDDAAHLHPHPGAVRGVAEGVSAASVFSFYATKTMTTGEGGMVVTADPALAARMKTMRLHGISRDVFDRYTTRGASWAYDVVAPGCKYNMPDPAAAMGRVQLARSAQMWRARETTARRYDAAFADLPLRPPSHGPLPADHSWHLYQVRLRDDAPCDRDTFVERMGERGIGCSVHFIPLHRLDYWRSTYGLDAADFPVAEREFARVVSLPLSSGLTDDQVERIIETVREVVGA